MSTLTVVIPTLDEERLVARVVGEALREADRVIVSDGGSEDSTREMAAAAGATVVSGGPGRGPQLNRGAAAAETDVLLFLHVDTRLPPGAGERVRAATAAGAPGGGFLMRWDSRRPIFRLGESIVNLRTRLSRAPLGDQAQFCARPVFDELGGFRDWPILEDLDFIRRLRRLGRPALIETPVTTSTRRFDRLGLSPTIVLNWAIFALYFLGVSPAKLARLYRARGPAP